MQSVKMLVLVILAVTVLLSVSACGRKGKLVKPQVPSLPTPGHMHNPSAP